MKLKKGYSEELKKLFAYTESWEEFESRLIKTLLNSMQEISLSMKVMKQKNLFHF